MIIPVYVARDDKEILLTYLENVKHRSENFPFPLWNLRSRVFNLKDGSSLAFIVVDILLPINIICLIGTFLSLAAVMFVSAWFLLASYFFLLLSFFTTDLWFYPVIKLGMRKAGYKKFSLYVAKSRALEMLVKNGTK